MTTAELRCSALSLPTEERAALAHDLVASMDAKDADSDTDALWATEIERRAREVTDGNADGLSTATRVGHPMVGDLLAPHR